MGFSGRSRGALAKSKSPRRAGNLLDSGCICAEVGHGKLSFFRLHCPVEPARSFLCFPAAWAERDVAVRISADGAAAGLRGDEGGFRGAEAGGANGQGCAGTGL